MNLYQAIEARLKAATQPLSCVDLFDFPEIRKLAPDVNKVSDALGNLWRRNYLGRETAPKILGSQARYAYFWREPKRQKVLHPAELQALQARAFDARPSSVEVDSPTQKTVLSRPSSEITDDGRVILIDLPQLQISIRTKT